MYCKKIERLDREHKKELPQTITSSEEQPITVSKGEIMIKIDELIINGEKLTI